MNLCVQSGFNHTASASTTKQTSTVCDVMGQTSTVCETDEMKKNSAYDTALAAVSTQLVEQEGEETTHDHEEVSQL